MALIPGARLGVYAVVAQIGAGGMGEVYKATDTNLKRAVALKVLPELVAADTERLARFQREAEVLATLNHPNIAAIYGLERSGSTTALVMEFVEGEDLSQRIARGAIPLDEAWSIAKQIADALEAAHEQGIIHRDLKPANIKVRTDGTVKVLDFGLAKAMEPTGGMSAGISQSPTVAAPARMTEVGMILGTTAYMSPEQARGKTVDKRTDIWSFGCVLYEMLTGRQAFGGATLSDTLAGILERQPDWTALPQTMPDGVQRLLRRCLRKELPARLRDIADARFELDEVPDSPARAGGGPERSSNLRTRLPVVGSAVVALLLGGAAGWIGNQRFAERSGSRAIASEVRLQIPTPPTTDPASLAISPDGSRVVFVATFEGRPLLWLRALGEVTARPIIGTDDASFPFWSPDGQAVGFFAGRMLKRVDLGVGAVQALAPADGGRGGAWNKEGTIVFQPTAGATALRTVPATGGESRELGIGPGRFPQFLPDGRHFIYSRTYGAAAAETRGLYVGSLDGARPKLLIEAADSAGVYSASGHVLFVKQGTLFAQPLDLTTLTTIAAPFPVEKGIGINGPLWLSPLSASAAGPIVYRTGSAGGLRQLAWFDRNGSEISRIGDPIPSSLSPAMSPDGQRIAFHRTVAGNTDIWLLDTIRGGVSRFTTGPGSEYHPVWSPDGRRLIFSDGQDLVAKSVTGLDSVETVLTPGAAPTATDWSSDGRFLLYTTNEPSPSQDIWAVSLSGTRKPFAVAHTTFNERDGQFSPDGGWIAYTSDESGRDEVYAQRFPEPDDRLQISTTGGGMARWRRDGRELYYIGLDGRLMVVALQGPSGAAPLRPSAPTPLFQTRIGPAVQANSKHQYMVSPDGQRFLMNTLAEEEAAPVTVILNWRARP